MEGVEIVAEVLDLLQLGTKLSCELLGSQDKEGNPASSKRNVPRGRVFAGSEEGICARRFLAVP